MGCALVISSLYPLYTFGRPFSGRHSINIFLICIELPVPVFLQKTALLASTSLEILERMPTLFCFCLPLILLVKIYRNFLCFFSQFCCQCAITHRKSYLLHQSLLCFYNHVCQSPLEYSQHFSLFFKCLALDLFPYFVSYQLCFVNLRASDLKSLPSVSYIYDCDQVSQYSISILFSL